MNFDRFSNLPLEIRLAILSCVTDLPTLHRLTYASPAMSAAFESSPVHVVRRIMCRIPRRCRDVMAATARAYDHRLSESSLDKHLTLTDIQQPGLWQSYAEEDARQDFDDILPGNSTRSIHWLILVACRVEQLTALFLRLHLERFNRLEIQHISDSSFRFPWESNRGASKPYPSGRPYTPQKRDTVSWVELFHATTACWGAQLRSFKSQLESDRTIRRESPNAQTMLLELERCFMGLPDWQRDQIDSAEELLSADVRAVSTMDEEALQNLLVVSGFGLTTPTELPSISEPPADEDAVLWGQGIQASERSSTAYHWFSTQARPDCWYNRLMRGLDWTPFRRLGFGFWDLQRMCTMGLSSLPYKDSGRGLAYDGGSIDKMKVGQVSFAWRSLKLDGKRLTPDPTEDGSAA